MVVTQAFLGSPLILPTTFFQVLPPSRVSCTLPSSVPTQIKFGFFGESEIAKIVVCISAEELSTVTPPDCSSSDQERCAPRSDHDRGSETETATRCKSRLSVWGSYESACSSCSAAFLLCTAAEAEFRGTRASCD